MIKPKKKYKNVVGFKNSICVRFSPEQLKQIKGLTLLHSKLYNNESHFIRCAVIKLINNHLNTKR